MYANKPPKLATVDNPLLLDRATMASVTGGAWLNLPDEVLLTGVSFSRQQMAEGTSGNLYFTVDANAQSESFNAKNLESIRKAIRAGAAAVVVPSTVQDLPTDCAVLKVDDPVDALGRLGFYVRDHLFTGRRVLVSGTRGKNDFKNMLQHVLSPQMPTHATVHDVDYGNAIVASLASIRQHDRVAVIEASAKPAGRLAVRSDYVRPHIAVLTDTGTSDAHGQNGEPEIVESHADIVAGLAANGYCLLNADSTRHQAIRQAVLARRRVALALFGSDAHCPGRLLAQRFIDNHWRVSADIEGTKVDYRLPLVGEHTPLLSVAVLLTAYYLGADLLRAAEQFADYYSYDSRGVLRRMACHGGIANLYQDVTQATLADFESFLQTASRLAAPDALGRKIAMIGPLPFTTEKAALDYTKLAQWIDYAELDGLVLVGQAMDATWGELKQPSRVLKRFPEYGRRHSSGLSAQPLIATVQDLIRPGDLLLLSGTVGEVGDYFGALATSQA